MRQSDRSVPKAKLRHPKLSNALLEELSNSLYPLTLEGQEKEVNNSKKRQEGKCRISGAHAPLFECRTEIWVLQSGCMPTYIFSAVEDIENIPCLGRQVVIEWHGVLSQLQKSCHVAFGHFFHIIATTCSHVLGGFLATHQLQQLFVAPRRVAAASLLLGMQLTPPASADEIDDEVAEYIKMMRSESVHSFGLEFPRV